MPGPWYFWPVMARANVALARAAIVVVGVAVLGAEEEVYFVEDFATPC
jgi:hypothetical protein